MISSNAWVAAVSGRPDIHFLSLFSLDFLGVDNKEAQLSRSLSTIFGIGIDDNGDRLLGVPEGEVWDTISQIQFKYFEVAVSPQSLCSAYRLIFHYTTMSKHLVKKRTRTGTSSETHEIDMDCSLSLPINAQTARLLKDAKTLYLNAYDNIYQSIDGKRIRVKKQID